MEFKYFIEIRKTMTNQRPQPDVPKVYRICKPCEYFDRCGMKPSKFAISKEFCNYYKAFTYSTQMEREEEAERRFEKMGDGERR